MGTDVRPIGTVFTENFPPSMFSTDDRPTRMTFVVVSHDECREGEFGREYVAEGVKCIKVEYLEPATVVPLRAYKSIAHWYEFQKEYAESLG